MIKERGSFIVQERLSQRCPPHPRRKCRRDSFRGISGPMGRFGRLQPRDATEMPRFVLGNRIPVHLPVDEVRKVRNTEPDRGLPRRSRFGICEASTSPHSGGRRPRGRTSSGPVPREPGRERSKSSRRAQNPSPLGRSAEVAEATRDRRNELACHEQCATQRGGEGMSRSPAAASARTARTGGRLRPRTSRGRCARRRTSRPRFPTTHPEAAGRAESTATPGRNRSPRDAASALGSVERPFRKGGRERPFSASSCACATSSGSRRHSRARRPRTSGRRRPWRGAGRLREDARHERLEHVLRHLRSEPPAHPVERRLVFPPGAFGTNSCPGYPQRRERPKTPETAICAAVPALDEAGKRGIGEQDFVLDAELAAEREQFRARTDGVRPELQQKAVLLDRPDRAAGLRPPLQDEDVFPALRELVGVDEPREAAPDDEGARVLTPSPRNRAIEQSQIEH